MSSLGMLYMLAIIDGMFVGYRDAMGRNPLLDKRRYYLRAMLAGIGLVHLALLVIAASVAATLWLSDAPTAATTALEQVADTMRIVYSGYAGCVALVFCVYALPNYDLRSYITVSAFGLLTLVRPFVIVAGATYAGAQVEVPGAWAVCAIVALAMAALQPTVRWLGWSDFNWVSHQVPPRDQS
jgi:hypothetical protein